MLAALAELGARKVVVLARSPQRAQRVVGLGRHWGVDVERLPLEATPAERVDVLVSTVPATAQQERAANWAALVRQGGLVFDVVYEPRETPLLAAATWAAAHVSTFYYEARFIALARRLTARREPHPLTAL